MCPVAASAVCTKTNSNYSFLLSTTRGTTNTLVSSRSFSLQNIFFIHSSLDVTPSYTLLTNSLLASVTCQLGRLAPIERFFPHGNTKSAVAQLSSLAYCISTSESNLEEPIANFGIAGSPVLNPIGKRRKSYKHPTLTSVSKQSLTQRLCRNS